MMRCLLTSLLLLSAGCRSDIREQAGVRAISERVESYRWADYRITTLQVGDGFGLSTPDGERPRFQVLAPADPEDRAYPVLLFLHGGSNDDDSELPEGASGYCGSAYAAETVDAQLRNSALAHQAIEAGWTIAVPENAFCDGWVGMGEADPVDTTHGGFRLATTALEWLLDEQVFVQTDPDRVHVVGSSMGSLGASFFVSRYERPIYSAGFAHGSINAVRLYYEDDYNSGTAEEWQGRLDHNLGGPPLESEGGAHTSWYPRYRDLSLQLAVEEGVTRTPLIHLWSDADPVSLEVAHRDMADALRADYSPEGVPWADYNSGVEFHSVVHSLDYPYATLALVRFLESLHLEVLEGEHGDGEVGAASVDAVAWRDRSGQGVRVAGAPGLLFSAPLQKAPEAGAPLRTTFFLEAAGEVEVSLRMLGEGGVLDEASVSADELSWTSRDYETLRPVLEATTLRADADGGPVTLEVSFSGEGQVALDVIVVDY
jgi:hypothetical protein